MRMRKKKHTDERIQACSEYMQWNDMLKKDKSAHMEIGCGKGDFICNMALKYPDINFIAVEKISDVLVIAVEKAKSLNIPNVRFVAADIKEFSNYLENDIISTIYLNFSDPWHKRYQYYNRLTYPTFLEIYKKILIADAKIIMKTDNVDFFDYSVKTISTNGFVVENNTHDLYNSEFLEGNVPTEYEKNFVSQNIKICYLSARVK